MRPLVNKLVLLASCGCIVFGFVVIYQNQGHYPGYIDIVMLVGICGLLPWLQSDNEKEPADDIGDEPVDTGPPIELPRRTWWALVVFSGAVLVSATVGFMRSPLYTFDDMLVSMGELLILVLFESFGIYIVFSEPKVIIAIRLNRKTNEVLQYVQHLTKEYKIVVTPELIIQRCRFFIRFGLFLMVMPVIGLFLGWSMKFEQMLLVLYFYSEEYFVWRLRIRGATKTP